MENTPDFPMAPAAFLGRSRRVDAGACFDWLRQGWALFAANPGLWLGATVLFVAIYLLLNIVPLVGTLAANLLLPVLAAGMLDLCRQQSDGRNPPLGDLFIGFQKSSGDLVLVGLIYAVAMLVVTLVVGLLVSGSLVGGVALGRVAGLGVLLGGFLLGFLLGIVLMVPVLMAVIFAPALVFFNKMAPVPAMKASFAACAENWLAFLVYGVFLFVLAFFAALPIGLGFLLLIPVTTGALYAAYRDIFPGT